MVPVVFFSSLGDLAVRDGRHDDRSSNSKSTTVARLG